MLRPLTLLAGLYVALAVAAGVWMYNTTLRSELSAVQVSGQVRLSEAASRLRLQVDGFRAQANFISNEPGLTAAIGRGEITQVTDELADYEATYGAWRIDLFKPDGTLITTSNANRVPQVTQALLRAARNGRLGFEQAIFEGHRLIRLSRSVRDEARNAIAVVVLSVDLAALEFEWPVSPEAVVFFSEDQISFSANRPELLFLSLVEDPEEATFGLRQLRRTAAHDIYEFSPSQGTSEEVIVLSKDVPHLDLTAQIFLPTEPARATARLRMMLVFASALVLGLIAAIAVLTRHRLALEAQHSATLEARVEARTEELRTAQNELVEASKLAALGRLAAGVSHELNQPLAAILNFSENGLKFIDRKAPHKASENFSAISTQIRRITRIIGNLRAFARQEVAPTETIDFLEVTQDAIDMVADDLKTNSIELVRDFPKHPIFVDAGRIRLEQVVLNLLTNAIDAMSLNNGKLLKISLHSDAEDSILRLRDTGPGVKDTSAVFEPFYTTKDLGASKGLGMGLSLVFGIVTRFGGSITCKNHVDGAEFIVTLPLAGGVDA